MHPLAMLLFLAAAPAEHRFVHFLSGFPVGEVTMVRQGARYTYTSRHYFRGGKKVVTAFTSDAPTVWASESLLRVKDKEGCWDVVDEVTRTAGQACVSRAGTITTGTLFGAPYSGKYGRQGLELLALGDSQFERSDAPVAFVDPFAEGFKLSGNGSALALVPDLEGARPAMPTPAGEDEDCLAAATAYVKAHPKFEVVLGLLDDGLRGWPHAWVQHRETHEEIDPSRPRPAGAPPRYLALPKRNAAAVYLDLVSRRRTLARVAAP